jgi:hypothetical protein
MVELFFGAAKGLVCAHYPSSTSNAVSHYNLCQ